MVRSSLAGVSNSSSKTVSMVFADAIQCFQGWRVVRMQAAVLPSIPPLAVTPDHRLLDDAKHGGSSRTSVQGRTEVTGFMQRGDRRFGAMRGIIKRR